MKNLITLILLTISSIMYAQEIRKVTQIDQNLYTVTLKDGSTKQTGFYINIDGTLVEHGVWTLRSDNKILTKGIFEKGELQQITVYENGERKTYTKNEIELNRLKRKIYRLENMLLSANN